MAASNKAGRGSPSNSSAKNFSPSNNRGGVQSRNNKNIGTIPNSRTNTYTNNYNNLKENIKYSAGQKTQNKVKRLFLKLNLFFLIFSFVNKGRRVR